jgi:uncharacterized protein YuzE
VTPRIYANKKKEQSEMKPDLRYWPDEDILTINVKGGRIHDETLLDNDIQLSYNKKGELIRLEVWQASRRGLIDALYKAAKHNPDTLATLLDHYKMIKAEEKLPRDQLKELLTRIDALKDRLDALEKKTIPTEKITEEEHAALDALEKNSQDSIPWEEERKKVTKRLRKAAALTDAIRTPATPGWDSTEEIRKWRDKRRCS